MSQTDGCDTMFQPRRDHPGGQMASKGSPSIHFWRKAMERPWNAAAKNRTGHPVQQTSKTSLS